jgi:hypothetical protein
MEFVMKRSLFPLMFIFAIPLLVAGCGKSAEMKKMESDLFASVKTMHDQGMAMMNRANDMASKIDETIAMQEKLAAEHPKEAVGASTDDLKAAKEKLSSAVTSMKEWMAGFKPYDPTMNHEEVMAQMSKAKDGIMKVKGDFDSGLAAASTAIDSHKAWADALMAKMSSMTKKGGKK